MDYQVLNDQRKVLINIQAKTSKELAVLIEHIKVKHPNLRLIAHVRLSDDQAIGLIKSCGFKQGDRLLGDVFEWMLPEFDEGCYGLNGCGG